MASTVTMPKEWVVRACDNTIAFVMDFRKSKKEEYINAELHNRNIRRKKWSWLGVELLTREEVTKEVEEARDGWGGYLHHLAHISYFSDYLATAHRLLRACELTNDERITVDSVDLKHLIFPEENGDTK